MIMHLKGATAKNMGNPKRNINHMLSYLRATIFVFSHVSTHIEFKKISLLFFSCIFT